VSSPRPTPSGPVSQPWTLPPPALHSSPEVIGAFRAELFENNVARLRGRLVKLTLARLLAVTGLLAVGLFSSGGAPSGGLIVTIVSLYVASIAYTIWLARGQDFLRLAVIQIGLDVSAYVAVASVTGGPASPLGFFVALPALSAALVLGSNAARVTAAICALGYGLITVSFIYRWPTALWVGQRMAVTSDELMVQLVGHGVAIPLVAALGTALAERLRRAGGALAALEEERDDLAALHEDVLRSIPIGLLTVNALGVVEAANPECEVILGQDAETLLGRGPSAALGFIPIEVWGSDRPHSGEADVEFANAPRHLAWTVSSLLKPNGTARGQLVVIEDRSQAEALREQVERAERLAVLGRLAAGLAHEIRNPLAAISGCVELVREMSAVTDEDRELLGTVMRECARLNRLVGDMLAFARPRPVERTRIELGSFVEDFVRIASRETSRVSVCMAPKDTAEVFASVDPQQLSQVLWNLVRNAAQASPTGERVELSVGVEEGAPAIFVADRGSGISRESKEKIFESFYSESASRGTGLGLAVVRQIMIEHGGTVEPRDRPGGGTVFVLRFPSTVGGDPTSAERTVV
jgi:two-component system sensor histidine kinase PilS (NtrC family)